MANLKLFNSLSGKKEVFRPLDPGHVRLYACGPTVYSYAHIGNARMAVVFDLLTTLLRHQFPAAKVTYVSNITDVDDKIMAAAEQTGEPIDVITQKFERIYNADMAALGCAPPDVQPRATEHIPEMIALCQTLIARGHAYEAKGHVLFNVPSYPAYGRLSNRSRDDQIAGARVEVAPIKRDPADFVLWKPSDENQPGWESPWGFGRPGWHIECSAMAEKHLGLPFDIHGGGADLKFPHHENEIAQSCCAHGVLDDPAMFAKFWVHNGFVTVEGEKMSKSLGNVQLAHDLLQKYSGEVLRLTLLSAHYRSPLDWKESTIEQMQKQLGKFYQHLRTLENNVAENMRVPENILEALLDDLNVPLALTRLNELADSADTPGELKGALLGTGKLLGILLAPPDEWLGYMKDTTKFDALLQERQQARQNKNFKRADEIRDELAAQGYRIEDTEAGPQLRHLTPG